MKTDIRQSGASIVEFIIAAPIVMLIGMTTVQAGLIYHGKTTLNYAAFEAARAGAVNNAQVSVMREALGLRLAPVQGGDGSTAKALIAIAKSSLAVRDVTTTHVEVLNPTTAAFDDWGVNSQTANQRVIPNNHLRHKTHSIGAASGLSLRDANLLKIQITYGIDMKIPVVSDLIAKSMMLIDPTNAYYYARGKFPVSSVATVRMQSEAWEDEIVLASAEAVSVERSDAAATTTPYQRPPEQVADTDSTRGDTGTNGDGVERGTAGTDAQLADSLGLDIDIPDVLGIDDCDPGFAGLSSQSALLQSSAYGDAQCLVVSPEYGVPEGDSMSNDIC